MSSLSFAPCAAVFLLIHLIVCTWQTIRVVTVNDMKPSQVEFVSTAGLLVPAPRGNWSNYVAGVVAQYKKDFP